MFQAQVNGTTIAYDLYGQGEPLLLIHGAVVSHEEWRPQLEPLGACYRLILPDVRGHGASAQAASPYTIRQFSDDLIGLLDALKIERCVALGHSMGGTIALEMAACYPERVRGLILAEAIYGAGDSLALRLRLAMGSLLLRVMGLERVKQMSVRQLAGNSPEMTRLLNAAYAPHLANPANFYNVWNANTHYDGRDRLPRVQCPTLVMLAANNPATHQAGHTMAQTIRGAQLVTIPDARHGLNWDNPQAFNTAVIEFLEKVIYGHETN